MPSVSVSHLPSYVFTRFSMVGHVAFRFRRSSQASHHPYSPFALRQQPQFCPQYPKCIFGDQCRNLLAVLHSSQYQLYQYGLHSEHVQIVSKLCAPTNRTIGNINSLGITETSCVPALSKAGCSALLTLLEVAESESIELPDESRVVLILGFRALLNLRHTLS